VAVEVLEIEGLARYPLVEDWTSGRHTAFAEDCRRPIQIRLVNREGKMVRGKVTVVLLQHDHAGPGAQEQPTSAFGTKADA
jgi:hypothetical protein